MRSEATPNDPSISISIGASISALSVHVNRRDASTSAGTNVYKHKKSKSCRLAFLAASSSRSVNRENASANTRKLKEQAFARLYYFDAMLIITFQKTLSLDISPCVYAYHTCEHPCLYLDGLRQTCKPALKAWRI